MRTFQRPAQKQVHGGCPAVLGLGWGSAQTVSSQGAESAGTEGLYWGLGAGAPPQPRLLLVLNRLPGCRGQPPAGSRVQLITCAVSQALQKQSSQEAHSRLGLLEEFGEHTGSVTEGSDSEGSCGGRSTGDKSGSCLEWGLPLRQWLLGITTCHGALCPPNASSEGLPMNLAEGLRDMGS